MCAIDFRQIHESRTNQQEKVQKNTHTHAHTNNEFKLLFDALEKQQQMKNRSIQEDRKKMVQKTKSVDKDDERQQNASKEA